MLNKNLKRKRRAIKIRAKIKRLGVPRLCVSRSSRHLYAQVIIPTDTSDKVIAVASSLDKEIKEALLLEKNVKLAMLVGTFIAKRALAAGVTRVAFDRSGFKYHGCIKSLAEAARLAGLPF